MDTIFNQSPSADRAGIRQHSQEFKRKVVGLAMQPGASVARVARDHGVNANQVFTWRRQHAAEQLGAGAPVAASEFLSVVVTPHQRHLPRTKPPPSR